MDKSETAEKNNFLRRVRGGRDGGPEVSFPGLVFDRRFFLLNVLVAPTEMLPSLSYHRSRNTGTPPYLTKGERESGVTTVDIQSATIMVNSKNSGMIKTYHLSTGMVIGIVGCHRTSFSKR